MIMSMLFMSVAHAQAGDYKLIKKEGLLSLYEKWITAINGEKTREIKAVFFVESTPAQAVALLRDQTKAMEWNPSAEVFKVINGTNDNNWISYIRYDIPWPVGDQDCCLQYTVRTTGSTTEVSFQSTTHSMFPVKNKVGRIEGTRGKWVFEKSDNSKMKITYIISTNKNTKIPKFIVDPIIHDNMMESMDLFTSLLENKPE
jgi:hypothetical protein